MDVAIYTGILKWRGENPYELIGSETHQSMVIAEKVFRQDILHDKAVWVNRKSLDFLYYLQCRHPLISCFYCPDKHPYSKSERKGTLLIMFSIGAFWAFASCLLALYGTNSVGIDIDVKGLSSSKQVIVLRLLCSMANGTILWICDLTLTKLHSCACAERQHSASYYIFLRCCSSFGIWIYFAISIAVFSFSLWMVIERDLTVMFLMVFSLQFICSWSLQIGGLYLRFRSDWKRDHRMMESGEKCIYYLSYRDYEEYRYSTKMDELSSSLARPASISMDISRDRSVIKESLLETGKDSENEDSNSRTRKRRISFSLLFNT